MLCAPPMCAPATHFLGCFSLRTGAAVVLAVDTLYGIILIVVHALILAQVQEPPGQTGSIIPPIDMRTGVTESFVDQHDHNVNRLRRLDGFVKEVVGGVAERLLSGQQAAQMNQGFGEAGAGGAAQVGHQHQQHQIGQDGMFDGQKTSWLLQFADLDFGFGHQLLGLTDQCNIVVGLVYGCIVTVICLYMLQAVVGGGANSHRLPTISRWFTSFAHLQLLVYLFIASVKLPKLCNPIQKVYLTHLYMQCDVLWYVYIQRCSLVIVTGSFMIWIFASFSFVLTFGHGAHTAVDKPEYHHGLDAIPERGGRGGYPGGPNGPPPGVTLAPPSRQNLVGPAVGAPGPSFSAGGYGGPGGGGYSGGGPPGYDPRYGGGGGGGGASFGGEGGYGRGRPMGMAPSGGQSYNVGRMPRASSSMATSATSHSEHHPLIKPPVAIY